MNYWVYENWTADDKAVIHIGSCGYCNEGKGCHEALHGELHGKWHGPFPSLAGAKSAANATGRPVSEHNCVNRGDNPMSEEQRNEDYSKEYSEESFWTKVGKYALVAGKHVIEKALALYYCMLDNDTPARAKAIIASALGYFIFPLDAIPDFTPFIGYSDDLGVLAIALGMVVMHIKPEHQQKAKEKLKQWFGEEKNNEPED